MLSVPVHEARPALLNVQNSRDVPTTAVLNPAWVPACSTPSATSRSPAAGASLGPSGWKFHVYSTADVPMLSRWSVVVEDALALAGTATAAATVASSASIRARLGTACLTCIRSPSR